LLPDGIRWNLVLRMETPVAEQARSEQTFQEMILKVPWEVSTAGHPWRLLRTWEGEAPCLG
jgi:hypothetical protein